MSLSDNPVWPLDSFSKPTHCKSWSARERIDADLVDVTHFSNCAGHILVEGCTFATMYDDPVNVHGAYFPALRRVDERRVRVELRHPQQAGAPVGRGGDRFELCRERSLDSYWSGVATTVERCGPGTVDLGFDRDLPSDLVAGDAFDNVDWYPDLTIRACHMHGNRARGPLISTRGRVLIENNVFRHPGAAIQMAGGLGLWCESGPVHDCTIRGNHFDRCAYNAPVWGSAVLQLKGEMADAAGRQSAYHRGISITGNRFTCVHDRVLDLRSVSGLRMHDNRIERADGQPIGS